MLQDYKEKPGNSPLTNAIRQNFWQKGKLAEALKTDNKSGFEELITSARDYMQTNARNKEEAQAYKSLGKADRISKIEKTGRN